MVDKVYCVYIHTNKINGKKYIGITSQDPEKRWSKGSGYWYNKYFYNSIQKYGWDNFKHEILCEGLSKEEASEKESNLIRQLETYKYINGYNQIINYDCENLVGYAHVTYEEMKSDWFHKLMFDKLVEISFPRYYKEKVKIDDNGKVSFKENEIELAPDLSAIEFLLKILSETNEEVDLRNKLIEMRTKIYSEE